MKTVNGGTAADTDFTLTAAGAVDTISGVEGDTSITAAPVTSGTYSLSESSVPNYTLTALTCNGTDVLANNRQVNVTTDTTCTFTNTYTPGPPAKTLTLKKTVINDDGLTATPADFTLSFTGPGGSGSGVQGSAPVTNAVVAAGTYQLSETGVAGYVQTSIQCDGSDADGTDGLTISADDANVTCTFTNDDLKDNRTEEETKRFVIRRLDNLLTYGPDRARMLRRLGEAPPEQQSLKDGPMKLNGAVSAPASTATTSRTPGMSTGSDPFASRVPTGSMALGANPFSTMTQQNEVFDPSRPDMQVQSGPTSTATGVLANIAGQLMPAAQDSGTIKFSTSLSELRAIATAAEQQRQNDLMMKAGLNFADAPYVTQPNGLRPGLDVWVEGTIVRYNDDLGGVNRDGDFSVLYVGADYVVSPGILVGALVQVDDTEEVIDDPTLKGNIEGRGWMAGPYIGIRLADNLYFDARAAWGRSDNDIDLTDTQNRTGSFETDRWLASATLTGNEYSGAWRFSPQISIAYGEEDYGSYSTSLQQTIPGGGASIGRVTGTMEVGYRFNGYGGSIIEPHVAISGIWNFDSDDLYVNGILADSDESRARVEGGLLITTPSGIGLRGAAGYDGIGANDFEAVSGSLWINIPFN
ncbi:MAG: autotransporter outer membrane beta-barrel domain-containing protein [Hyphomicrobium sp.]|nr:autotransporter outer membrane beta-barrel domain-containing protein [Hyphomicrobium sp.]